MTDKHDQWRLAYARQARADLDARDALIRASPRLPACEHLHFLQMACEKLCKAHLSGQGTDQAVLRTSHAYITGPMIAIARSHIGRETRSRRVENRWMVGAIELLARRIELLAPAVDDGGSVPANCEYPWVGPDGTVIAPVEHDFGIDLGGTAGRYLLKVLRVAVDELCQAQA